MLCSVTIAVKKMRDSVVDLLPIHMKRTSTAAAKQEELLSSMDIQDWNLKTFAREIYDNIGQILSLAKFQIATLNPERKEETNQIVEKSDLLLAKAIKDLRNLAKQLTPTEIVNKGFVVSLQNELERVTNTGICKTAFEVKGEKFRLEGVRELILFSILQHYIYKALYEQKAKELSLHILFGIKKIDVELKWLAGITEMENKSRNKISNSVQKRSRLINAVIKMTGSKNRKSIQMRIKK
jgi:signal transduction histidine kinase